MPEVSEATPYSDWITRFNSSDEVSRLSAQHEMVLLFDKKGRPQRVRGSNVAAQLAKKDSDGNAAFSPGSDALRGSGYKTIPST